MPTSAPENTAFDLFLSQLPSEDAAQIRQAASKQNVQDFLVQTVATTLQSRLNENKLQLPEGYNPDDVLNAARKWHEQTQFVPQQQSTHESSPEEGFSWSKFFNTDNQHEGGGGGSAKEPDMHNLIKKQQEEELRELFEKAATNPQEKEALLNKLLERFESKAFFGDYQTKFIANLEKLPSFQKLNDEQKKGLKTQLEQQHVALNQDFEHGTGLTEQEKEKRHMEKEKRNAALRPALENLLSLSDRKLAAQGFSALVKDHQRPYDYVAREKYRPTNPLWEPREYVTVFEELYYLPQNFLRTRELAGFAISTQPQYTVENIPDDDDSSGSSAQQGARGAYNRKRSGPLRRAGQRLDNAARNWAKNRLLKKARNKIVQKALEKVAENGLWAAITNPEVSIPLLIAAIVIVVILIVILIVILFLMSHNSSSSSSSPQPTPTPAAPSLSEPCLPTNTCAAKLKALGINLSGDLGAPLPDGRFDPYGKAFVVYQALSLAMKPPSNFGKLLGLPKQSIDISFVSAHSCAGHASFNGTLVYYGWCSTSVIDEFMILHEIGHLIDFRQPGLFWKFFLGYKNLPRSFQNMPTYNCMYDYGTGPYAPECWADMVGEYVLYRQYRDTVGGRPPGPYNFPTFPNFAQSFYYNFAKNNIFNGVSY